MTVKEIKKEIAELKATDKLHKAVINDIISEAEYYNGNSIERIIERCDDVSHGCSSGIVGGLVYYHQTTAFFKKYRDEIEALLVGCLADFGPIPIKELLRDWDESDPFARDIQNQNLLAWFAYEEINSRLLSIVEQYQ
jgi:hypothetical protein